jgi:hypothetical protein
MSSARRSPIGLAGCPPINDAAGISWTGGSLALMLCAVETGARRGAPMTDDLKELLDDTHFAAMAHAVAADTDDDGGTSAVVEFLERRAADQVDLDRRALVDRFRERIETAQRVDPTYGAYDDLLAADHVK